MLRFNLLRFASKQKQKTKMDEMFGKWKIVFFSEWLGRASLEIFRKAPRPKMCSHLPTSVEKNLAKMFRL